MTPPASPGSPPAGTPHRPGTPDPPPAPPTGAQGPAPAAPPASPGYPPPPAPPAPSPGGRPAAAGPGAGLAPPTHPAPAPRPGTTPPAPAAAAAVPPHLLVTNDFPPKVGGIQSYLWELWRRLPPASFAVLTTRYPGDRGFDAAQPFRIERHGRRILVPTPALVRRIRSLAAEVGAAFVVLDPALPLGLVGPRLGLPYVVVLHGAEVTVPGRLPSTRRLLAGVLRGAAHVVAAGHYPLAEAERAAGRALPATVVPPGVDTARFRPLAPAERTAARAHFGLPPDPGAEVVAFVSRLVPRKGADVLIRAGAHLAPRRPRLVVAVAGAGRDRPRLERLAARLDAPVRFVGRVPDADLPAFYGCADVFVMPCRNRWGGLEQEGFGIVFLEAAACGVPVVAGRSGGAAEAVDRGTTGLVLDDPRDDAALAATLEALLADPARRRAMGEAGRRRAEAAFDDGVLAARLAAALARVGEQAAAGAGPGNAALRV